MKTRHAGFAAVAAALIGINGVQAQVAPATAPEPAMTGSMPESGSGKSVTGLDKAFFRKAAIGGMTEVEAGKLAVAQGSSPEVKAFGQRMVDEHGTLGMQLQDLAAKKGVTLPAAPDAAHQAMLDELKGKQGADFDGAFVSDMKKGHADAIHLFKLAGKLRDPDISAFAKAALPTLQDHEKSIPRL